MGAPGMKRGVSPISIAAGLAVALLATGCTFMRDTSGERAGELLERVIEHYQNGELEPAWDAYAAFFADPGRNNVSVTAFGHCFYQSSCPALGVLASVLGKSEAEAGDFRGFCPDWNGLVPSDDNRDDLSDDERLVLKFRNGGMGGSCAEWAARQASWFDPRPADLRPAPQVVPLEPLASRYDRPQVEVNVLGTPVKALFSTGATLSAINGLLAEQNSEQVEYVRRIEVTHGAGRESSVMARLERIRIGEADFSRPVVAILSAEPGESGEPSSAESGNSIGMNLLLQYGSVCFDWEEQELHLGRLGPCEGGATPYRGWLDGQLGISVDAKVSSIDSVRAEISTGSNLTYCSEWFMEQMSEGEAFSFGSDDALTGICTYDPDFRFNNQERGAEPHIEHIVVGMDTLSQFAAFGWQLNPFRVYFVP